MLLILLSDTLSFYDKVSMINYYQILEQQELLEITNLITVAFQYLNTSFVLYKIKTSHPIVIDLQFFQLTYTLWFTF